MADHRTIAEHVLNKAGIPFTSSSLLRLNRADPGHAAFVLLVFVDGNKKPAALIKGSPDPAKARQFQQEFDTLTFIHDRTPESFAGTVPRALYFGDHQGLTVLAETVVPGTRLKNLPPDNYFSSDRYRHDLGNVVQWLCDFHGALAPTEPTTADAEIRVVTPLAAFRKSFLVSPRLADLLEAAGGRLISEDVPLTPWHGDFCTANVLVAETGRISVIDWEHAPAPNWPLCDLLHFLASTWAIPYQKGGTSLADNYRALFFTRSRHYELIRQVIAEYARNIGFRSELVQDLSVMVWVNYANRKRAYLDNIKATTGRTPASDRHLPLIMIENDTCLNLEMLASNGDDYVLNGL